MLAELYPIVNSTFRILFQLPRLCVHYPCSVSHPVHQNKLSWLMTKCWFIFWTVPKQTCVWASYPEGLKCTCAVAWVHSCKTWSRSERKPKKADFRRKLKLKLRLKVCLRLKVQVIWKFEFILRLIRIYLASRIEYTFIQK